MADAAYYREQAKRGQRLIDATTDQLTCERLAVLVAEYLTKAQALEAGPASDPPETM